MFRVRIPIGGGQVVSRGRMLTGVGAVGAYVVLFWWTSGSTYALLPFVLAGFYLSSLRCPACNQPCAFGKGGLGEVMLPSRCGACGADFSQRRAAGQMSRRAAQAVMFGGVGVAVAGNLAAHAGFTCLRGGAHLLEGMGLLVAIVGGVALP
jgi:hypothetical protein